MPVAAPLAQKASGNGTQVHWLLGAAIGGPASNPPAEVPPVVDACPVELPLVAVPPGSALPQQPAREPEPITTTSARARFTVALDITASPAVARLTEKPPR